jgi:hypothetical protein
MAHDIAPRNAMTPHNAAQQVDDRINLRLWKGAIAKFMAGVHNLNPNACRVNVAHAAPPRSTCVPSAVCLIDHADDGDVYNDNTWNVLNPIGFRYGNGGVNAQTTRNTGALTDSIPGFLTHYATTGVEEDKAELFAFSITHKDYIAIRIRTDTTLAAKLTRLQAILKNLCPGAQNLITIDSNAPTTSHSAYPIHN